MTPDRAAILRAFAASRLTRATIGDRAALERRQMRLWRRMRPVIAATPAIAHLAGKPLAEFPIMEPAAVRDDFARWNTVGLGCDAVRAAADEAETGREGSLPHGLSAGFSSGTNGARGMFLTSPAERARYLGEALSRLAPPGFPFRPLRIALCLRANAQLYRDVVAAGPVRFAFLGLDADGAALEAFDPHVLIAPPHALASHAARGIVLPSLKRLYWAAEPAGEAERAWIGAAFKIRPDPVYQATEGFLGAPCAHGCLHLNEDAIVVERDPVEGTNRFRPIVTDLVRRTQPVIRLRLDDLLEPLEGPCPCGSPLLAVRPVEGRVGDLWRWGRSVICPREVDGAMSAALGPAAAWRATARADQVLIETAGVDGAPAAAALTALLTARVGARSVACRPWDGILDGPKRARVRWSDG